MLRRTVIVVILVCAAWLLFSFSRGESGKVIVIGPIVHERITPVNQNIDLLTPPPGFKPPVWEPGQPYFDPGDLKFAEKISFARESWYKRWLHWLCCTLFSCHPEPPEQPPVVVTEPTTISVGVDVDGIQATSISVPDPVGDIGLDHYVQAVNSAFQVFSTSGAELTDSQSISVLWDDTGSPCEEEPPIDPIVRYDAAAERWLISGFVWENFGGENFMCIAVSKSQDPVSGGWYLYELKGVNPSTNSLFSIDAPKLSVWPDAYYLTTFAGAGHGIDVWALDRSKMLAGQTIQPVRFRLPNLDIILLPGDVDGPAPPADSPGWFARQVDGERVGDGVDRVEVYSLSVDWAAPANSKFELAKSLPVDPFDSILCTANEPKDFCVPQVDTTQKLETFGLWPQWRLQYRNMGQHESLLFNHTVDADGAGQAGIRWYELRRPPGGDWAIAQQGTHQDQDLGFFMGGISMDGKGNIALGYTASSATTHPGIRIAHRVAGDAPGSMPGTEYLAVEGFGSQLDPNGRWGNYSTMDVDPGDDCTFWYTHEYYKTSSKAGWSTRIVSFKLQGCQ